MNIKLRKTAAFVLALVMILSLSTVSALAQGSTSKLPTRVIDAESRLDYGTYSYNWKDKTLSITMHGDNSVDYNEPFRVNSNRNYKNIITLDTDDSTVLGLNDLVLSGDINRLKVSQRVIKRTYGTDRGQKKWITNVLEANEDMKFTVADGKLQSTTEDYRQDVYYYMDEDLGKLTNQDTMTQKTTTRYQYDKAGNLTEIHRQLRSRDLDDEETMDFFFTYDIAGNLNSAKEKVTQKNIQGMVHTDSADAFVDHRVTVSNIKDYTYEYNDAGQLTRATKRDSRSTKPEHSYKTYTYNPDGTIKTVYFEDKKQTKEPESSDLFERVKAKLSDPDQRTKTFNYEYASKGDLQK